MDRVAVFVDAGYLFAQGAIAKFGGVVPRAELQLNVPTVIGALTRCAEETAGLPLLRVYWYDGARPGQPSPEQTSLAIQDNVKLRLGVLGFDGKQKGVDSLVVTDMITLARNGAMAACLLLSGDDDLRVGVQQAQEFGVRVALLGIVDPKSASSAQSDLLRREADATKEWTAQHIVPFLERSESLARSTDDASKTILSVAERVAQEVPQSEAAGIVQQYVESQAADRAGYLDRTWNGELLRRAGRALQRALDAPAETDAIRAAFVDALRERLSAVAADGDDSHSTERLP